VSSDRQALQGNSRVFWFRYAKKGLVYFTCVTIPDNQLEFTCYSVGIGVAVPHRSVSGTVSTNKETSGWLR